MPTSTFSVSLGASVLAWKTQLLGYLTAAGWVVHDDQFPSGIAGYVILRTAADVAANGYLEFAFDGTTMKMRAWSSWNATLHTGLFASVQVSRTVDLANGMNVFLSAESSAAQGHAAIAFESSSSISTLMVGFVKTPDAEAKVFQKSGMKSVRAGVAQPSELLFFPTHWVAVGQASSGSQYGGAKTGDWEMNPGDTFNAAAGANAWLVGYYKLGAFPNRSGDTNEISNYLGVFSGAKRPAYQPNLFVGFEQTSATDNVFIARVQWNSIPGVWLSASSANDKTKIRIVDTDQWHGLAPKANLGATMTSGQLTMVLAGDLTDVPTSGTWAMRIESEFVICTARSGVNVTLSTRGAYGSTAAAHTIATAATLVDAFTRADGAPGANYTVSGSANGTSAIASNKLRFGQTTAVAGAIEAAVAASGLTSVANVDIALDIDVTSAVAIGGLFFDTKFRVVDANNHYFARATINTSGITTFQLYKRVAGVNTLITQIAITAALTGNFRVTISGSLIKFYWNGIGILGVIDTTFTAAGGIGLRYEYLSTTSALFVLVDNLSINQINTDIGAEVVLWGVKFARGLLYSGTIEP
jgi:hypothetical protein